MSLPRTSGIVCFLVFVLSCGGGNSGPSTSNGTSTTVSASKGGTVSLTNGPSLQIPAGALAADTTITIQRSVAQTPSGALTAIYSFGPEGTAFSNPVSVSFPVPSGTSAASIYWTAKGSTTEYESVPTTIINTTASAQITHFSSGYVGALDVSGTWAGTVSYTRTDTNGAPIESGTYQLTRDVTQTGNTITYNTAASVGWSGTCTGRISGTSVTATASEVCQLKSLDGTCTLSPTRTDTVDNMSSPMTMTTSWSGTYAGSSCALGGSIAVNGSLTKQSSSSVNVAGTWSGSYNETITTTSQSTISASGTITKIRTQVGSVVTTSANDSNGSTLSCLGPIIGNTIYFHCDGRNGSCIFGGYSVTTVHPSVTPMTGSSNFGWTYGSACGNYATSSGTETDTKQPAVNPPPAAPTGVTATPGNAQVTISWTGVSGATSYNIYWSTAPGVTKVNGSKITGATNPYVQPVLTNGTAYYYVVTAVNANGESTVSMEVSATPSSAPYIKMTVLTLSGGGVPLFGFLENAQVCSDSNCTTRFNNATVTVNGTALAFDTQHQEYRGTAIIAAGATVTAQVTIGPNTFNVTGTQFTTPPTVSAPASGATWQHTNANTISWTGGAPTTGASYFVALMDGTGSFVLPGPQEVSIATTSFSVPANTVSGSGSYNVLVAIGSTGLVSQMSGGIPIANAASGSGLWLGIIAPLVPVTVQ
jgi:hypothetical protein